MNDKQYVFVGGPYNGRKFCTEGVPRFIVFTHNWGKMHLIRFARDNYIPQESIDTIDRQYHEYILENFSGVLFYRYIKDNQQECIQKLVNNYKPKKRKL